MSHWVMGGGGGLVVGFGDISGLSNLDNPVMLV